MKHKSVREALSFVFAHPQPFFWILVFDIVVVALMFLGRPLLGSFDSFFQQFYGTWHYSIWLSAYIVSLLFVFFLFTSMYGVFKFCIMGFLDRAFRSVSFQFTGLFDFLKVTLKLLLPLLALCTFILVNLLGLMTIKSRTVDHPLVLAGWFFLGLLIMFFLVLVLYAVSNIIHFLFWKDKEKVVFRLFKQFRFRYLGFFWHAFKVIIVMGILLGVIHLVVKNLFFQNFLFYVNYYWVYKRFLWLYGFLVLYFIITFTRIYLYEEIVYSKKA